MMFFLRLKNKVFGWEYAYFVWKEHCSGRREIKRIKTSNGNYFGRSHSLVSESTRTLEPRGRFGHQEYDYMEGWEPITDGLREFYESEPPQATRTPGEYTLVDIDKLTSSSINYIIAKYNLQRIENKPKTTQQEYTGKRLIQL